MKLLASAAGIACCALLAVLAAPALSLQDWQPRPVDFELAPGGGRVSPTIDAPKRFNLVGMRWRGNAEPRIAIRARRDGGRWSRWAPLGAHPDHAPDPGRGEPAGGASAPAWVGEADQLQYRLSRRPPGLRLHFVNVDGTATAADRAQTALRRVANTAVSSLAAPFRAEPADAQAGRPAMVSRAGWGASRCTPRSGPGYGEVKAAMIHHTVSINNYSREEAPGIVLGICRYHRNSNGWDDIGYNFLVDKYGTLYEGRAGGTDRAVVGAQAQGFNAQTTGISNIGTYSGARQTPAALRAMARLIRWKLPLHGAPTAGTTTLVSGGGSANRYPSGARVRLPRISGHRDVGKTECPGGALYVQLAELRRLVGGAGSFLDMRLPRRSVPYKRSTYAKGRLASALGAPYAGEEVRIQVRRKRRWRTVTRVRTDSGGRYRALLVPRVNRRVRARFYGYGGRPSARSSSKLLKVRPRIAVRAPDTVAAERRVRLLGRSKPRKRRLYLVVQRPRGDSWKRVLVKRIDVRRRSGRFSASFLPRGRGRYRFYVVARKTRSQVRGRSKPRVIVVGRPAGALPARRR